MELPFTTRQFLEVFRSYNQLVFPIQILLNTAAIIILFLIIKNVSYRNGYISILFAFLWLWAGIVYHIFFFSEINPAAFGFGVLFIIQGILFLYYGTALHKLNFQIQKNAYGVTGSVFIVYSLVLYPLIGMVLGHSYPSSPTFGVPCPVTIFTIGAMLLTLEKIPFPIIIIPFIWSLISFSAAVNLTIYEDLGLFIAGAAIITVFILKKRKTSMELKNA
jgi:hypothetical protein